MKLSVRLAILAVVLSAISAEAQSNRTPAEIADRARIQGANGASVWLVIVGNLAGKEDRGFRYDLWPVIDSLFVRPGKIRVAWINLPDEKSKASWTAAEVALCASTDRKFWAPHDIILWEQARWMRLADPTESLVMLAAQKGARPSVIRDCMQTKQMRKFLEADIVRAHAAGITRAPGFIIDNEVYTGPRTAAGFRAALDRALAKHGAASR